MTAATTAGQSRDKEERMRKSISILARLAIIGSLTLSAATAYADDERSSECRDVPSHAALRNALEAAQGATGGNGGFGLEMWATVVNRDGVVCAVAFTGRNRGDQWPGSRVISAQKANTANAFSLDALALSTANLFSAVQPGGSLFGLQESNPVDPDVAYGGNPADYGTVRDYMVGKRIGGVNVFGGGLALYDALGNIIGAVGVSGDTSCADHNIAWKVRDFLALDYVPGGVSPTHDDNIIYDITDGVSAGGFGHPDCGNGEKPIGEALPTTNPISHPMS
jgi:uncharacterized protein GlcG (DUF336 family)